MSRVIWLTGMAGAGKTTLGEFLAESCVRGVLFDADDMRKLWPELGFVREAKRENTRRLAAIAGMVASQETPVVVANISPYKSDRDMAKELIEDFGAKMLLVHVDCAPSILRQRREELYATAKNLAGGDAPYEKPERPDVYVNSGHSDIYEMSTKILRVLKKGDYSI